MHKKTFYRFAAIMLGITLTASSWSGLSVLASDQAFKYLDITDDEGNYGIEEKEESVDKETEESTSESEDGQNNDNDFTDEDGNSEELTGEDSEAEEDDDLSDEDEGDLSDEGDITSEDEDDDELTGEVELDEDEAQIKNLLPAVPFETPSSYTLNLSDSTTFEEFLDEDENLVLSETAAYHLSGSFNNTIIIDADDVQVFLNNVTIHSESEEGIRIENGASVTLNTGETASINNTITAAPSKTSYGNAGYAGIRVGADSTLTIEGKGKLTVTGTAGSAGIGGSSADSSAPTDTEDTIGTIIINGGVINAASGYLGSGIGGGLQSRGGTIIINSGKVTSTGDVNQNTGYNGSGGAGIGGGSSHRGTVDIEIHGGTVTAYGGTSAAGIGGGSSRGGDIQANITITDGKIKAYGGDVYAAGIGTGWAVRDNNRASSNTATIEISGGTIYAAPAAVMGNYTSGVGIGAGGAFENDDNVCFADIAISGGTITAHGGMNGAGIGASDYASANILIQDGNILATGLFQASAIGAYKPSDIMDIRIEGGVIAATADVSTSWGATTYYGRGAGIGTFAADMSAIYIGENADITAFARNNGAINGIIESDRPLLNAYFANQQNYYEFPHDDDFELVYSNSSNSDEGTLLFPKYHHSFAVTGEASTYQFVTSAFEDGALCWYDNDEEILDFDFDSTGAFIRVGFTSLPDDGGGDNGGGDNGGGDNGGGDNGGGDNGGGDNGGGDNGGGDNGGGDNGGGDNGGGDNGGGDNGGGDNGGGDNGGGDNGGGDNGGGDNGGGDNGGGDNGGGDNGGGDNGGGDNGGGDNGSGDSGGGNGGSSNGGNDKNKSNNEDTNLVTILPNEVPGTDSLESDKTEDTAFEPEALILETVPKTSDNYQMLFYILLAGFSSAFAVILRKRRSKSVK